MCVCVCVCVDTLQNSIQSLKKKKIAVMCGMVQDKTGGHYTRQNKPDRGRQIAHGITFCEIGGKN